jgi:hypothetical protein
MLINALDVKKLQIEPGGQRFTEFVDALIRTEARIHSIQASLIATCLKTNAKDGGVDTRVDTILPGRNDWFEHKTIWQYKAMDYGDLAPKLTSEFKKAGVIKRIEEGYAYRLAICDGVPSETVTAWETELTEAARKINPNSAIAKVVTADALADWVRDYPAIALCFLQREVLGHAIHLQAWGKSITEQTPKYVSISASHAIATDLRSHVDLSHSVPDVVMSIIGESGSGKSRLVFEALRDAALDGLVLYVDNEDDAQYIAKLVAAFEGARKLILVADESTPAVRELLRKMLRGYANSVRVISIDSSERLISGLIPEYQVKRPLPEDVREILRLNFPEVPQERRYAYSDLCEGFVQLAADLCRNDAMLMATREFGSVFGSMADYFHNRLDKVEQGLEVVLALSLFTKVGYIEEVSEEFDALCSLVQLEKVSAKATAHKLHDNPGFIGRSGRFFNVVPKIIAQVAFREAWQTWIANDPSSFMKAIPGSLIQQFINRVLSSEEGHRRIVGDHFLRWASNVDCRGLVLADDADRLVALVEMQPETYLARLRQILTQADKEDIIALSTSTSGWSSRRRILFLLVRMAAFAECFGDVELCLLRLASVETEPTIGNNATNEWHRLFQIAVSGTPIHFNVRFDLLKKRLLSEDGVIRQLALGAMEDLLQLERFAQKKDTIIGGRFAPPEWIPETQVEYKDCLDRVVQQLFELCDEPSFELVACELLIDKSLFLLQRGYSEKLRTLYDKLNNDRKIAFLLKCDQFLEIFANEYSDSERFREYLESLRTWINQVRPRDLHSRILAEVGSFKQTDTESMGELHSIGEELISDRAKLDAEIEFLVSETAVNTLSLGIKLGELDHNGKLLEYMVARGKTDSVPIFVRGYVYGLQKFHQEQQEVINRHLDILSDKFPAAVCDIAITERNTFRAFDRIRLFVERGALPLHRLRSVIVGEPGWQLTQEQTITASALIQKHLSIEPRIATELGITLFGIAIGEQAKLHKQELLRSKQMKSPLWDFLLSAEVRENFDVEAYWWLEIMQFLADLYPREVAEALAAALFIAQPPFTKKTIELLVMVSAEEPDYVFAELQRVLLDSEKGWHFLIGDYDLLFEQLDALRATEWIHRGGVELARMVARHLPKPRLENGTAYLHALTRNVLTDFGDDEQVFRNFLAGTASTGIVKGSMAAKIAAGAEIARNFLNDPAPQIQKWAMASYEASIAETKHWKTLEEEMEMQD